MEKRWLLQIKFQIFPQQNLAIDRSNYKITKERNSMIKIRSLNDKFPRNSNRENYL